MPDEAMALNCSDRIVGRVRGTGSVDGRRTSGEMRERLHVGARENGE